MKQWMILAVLGASFVGAQAQGLREEELKFIQEQEKLQREQMLLKMQVQVLEQKAKAAELQRKIDGVGAPSSAAPLPSVGAVPGLPGLTPIPVIPGATEGAAPGVISKGGIPRPPSGKGYGASSAEEVVDENFQLMSVFGRDGDLQAEILLNGTRIRVKLGDSVGSGWRVSSIQPTKIELNKGKQRKTLTF